MLRSEIITQRSTPTIFLDMSKYYNPQKTRGLFDPQLQEPFVISRSGIDLFIQCPRCFYLDKRLGTGRPPGFPFSLNSAVDALLKKEFDGHRVRGSTQDRKSVV